MITLITYLLRTSRTIRFSGFFVLAALAAGLLSGAGFAALIAALNSALSGRRGTEDLWVFVSLCLAVFLTRLASQALFDFVALKTVSGVRLQLCRRILAAPLDKLEEAGSQRLAGALFDDIPALSNALTQLPRVFINLAISLACLAYLSWLSWKVLPFFLGFMAVGTLIHQVLLAKTNLFLRRLREQRDRQLAQLRALTEGAKELKLQRWRRLDLMRSGLIPTSEAIRRFTLSGNTFSAGASTWGNILFFIAVVLLLAGPGRWWGLEQSVITGYTLTLLYMLLPLELFFLSLPALGRAAAAARKLESLGLQLAASPEPVAGGSLPVAGWRSLDLAGVTREPNRRKPMRDALQLIAFLMRISRGIPRAAGRIFAALALSVFAGIFFPLLVATLGAAITRGLDRALLLGFLALCAAAPCARLASQRLFDAIAMRALFDLRLELCRKLLAAPLARQEEIGARRLLASLNDGMAAVASTFGLLPLIAMQIGVAAGLLAYMAWLSPHWFLLVAGFYVLGLGVLLLPGIRTRRDPAQASRETDAMSAHLRDLIEGGKELKLDRERRQAFLDRGLVPAEEALRRSAFLGSAVATAADTWGMLLFFILPGMVLFGAGRSGTALPVLAGYALALLYIRTPTGFLLQSSVTLGRANAAAAALEKLASELAATTAEPEGESFPATWQRLELRAITYTSTLGPVSLELAPGEIVFLLGENGSGKTALAKVLTGLFPPDDGQILLDGTAVSSENRDGYRQMFSAVFADFYPFEPRIPPGAEVTEYLKRLQLEDKVTVEGGKLSTVDLSPEQRKRLALVSACLEDRPIYLFDEWAAGQDPSYKQFFYLELLPEMKARGKAVVVISNDDTYYPVADRLVKLTQGKIEWERRPSA